MLGLLSCQGHDDTAAFTWPTAHSHVTDTGADLDVDFSALEADLNTVFQTLRSINGQPIIDVHDEVMTHTDGQCPGYTENNGSLFWYAACTSSVGTAYNGYLFYTLYDGEDLFGDGNAWDAWIVTGAADVTTATGETAHFGGQAYTAHTVQADNDQVFLWYTGVGGSFYADTASAQGTWLTDGGSAALQMYAATYAEYGINIFSLQGDLSLNGSISAMHTDALFIYTEYPGVYPCAEEPTGTLQVRTADGTWLDIAFDIDPSTLDVDAGRCDGCGTVSYQSDVIGEICIDASPLVDWKEAPW